jgi:hypothetical protein
VIVLEVTTPAELAKQLGWSEKRVRRFAKKLGACRVLGNRMALLREDVQTILEATRLCPSNSIGVKEVMSGTTEGQLPEIGYEDLLGHLTAKRRRVLRPRSKTDTTNVISMGRKKS